MVRSTILASLIAAASAVLGAVNSIPGRYLVEFEDGHDESSIIKALDGGATTRVKLDYKLFKGVSLHIHDIGNAEEKAKKIAEMPSVRNIWKIKHIRIPNHGHNRVVGTPEGHKRAAQDNKAADTFLPHVMTQVDRLRAKGLTGEGVKVAFLDSGVDYTHSALGKGCFGKPHCLVSFGTDLVGDAFTGFNDPVPDNDPMDCSGHGTNTAGIIAAQKNPFGFTGAAPGVKLGAYRVFGCSGTTTTDVIISAYNKAFEDGANIISASIEAANGWSEDAWAVVASRIVEKGVPCTVAAGNHGDRGLFYVSSPAGAKKVTAVASYNSVLTPIASFHSKYSIDGGSEVDFTYTPGENSAWDVSMPVYATSLDATIANDACAPLPGNTPDLSKYIVLVRRGTCIFPQKAHNIAAKGAKYILFYNNVAGTYEPSLGDATSSFKVAGLVTREVGESWVKRLKAGSRITLHVTDPHKAKIDFSYHNYNETGGAVSSYTSWGPTWDMDLKPQIGAAGADILTTSPVAQGSYAVVSGTSRSCPLVAAIIALVAQARGTLEPELINDLLSATAKPQLFNDGTKFYSKLAPAAQQGGGMVQAYDAAYTTSLLYPSSLSFNDSDHFAANLNFAISNRGKKSVTYKLGHVSAMTMYTLEKDSVYPMAFPNEAVDAQATLAFSRYSVTLAPGNRASIRVSPKAPRGLDARRLPLWSGYITVNGTDGSALSLPYQGLVGSLHSATVLIPDQSWVTSSSDTEASPPKHLTTEFMGVKTIGQPFGLDGFWNPRGNSSCTWDGQLESGSYAPAGKYKFVTRALKIWGDARKKKDWDTASTQSFYLEYKKK